MGQEAKKETEGKETAIEEALIFGSVATIGIWILLAFLIGDKFVWMKFLVLFIAVIQIPILSGLNLQLAAADSLNATAITEQCLSYTDTTANTTVSTCVTNVAAPVTAKTTGIIETQFKANLYLMSLALGLFVLFGLLVPIFQYVKDITKKRY